MNEKSDHASVLREANKRQKLQEKAAREDMDTIVLGRCSGCGKLPKDASENGCLAVAACPFLA